MNGMQGLFNVLGGGSMMGMQDMLTPEQQRAIQQQSMMAMAAKLLQAGGPSTTPTSLGQALGGAFEAGQGAIQSGQTNAVQQMLLGQKLEDAKLTREQRQAFNRMLGGGAPAMPGATAAPAGMPMAGGAPAMPGVTADPSGMPMPMDAATQPVGSLVAGLTDQQRALLSTMPMGDATKFILDQSVPKDQPTAVREYQFAVGQGYRGTFEQFNREQRRAGAVNLGAGGVNLTPLQQARDKDFAKIMNEWESGGGADTVANIAQIGTVLERLESGQPLTGPMIGIQPDFVLAITDPGAAGAKEQVQEVVQRNLRVILGAQFTEKEGTMLINRAYNPTLPPEQNAARLRKLFAQMSLAAQQRQAMVDYASANGTLQGYRGPQPSVNDFYKALEVRAPGEATSTNPVADELRRRGVR